MTQPLPLLLVQCRLRLHFNQQQLADLVGSSLRTVQRWEAARSTPVAWELHKLADAVRLRDPELASQVDALAPRPASPAAPAPAPLPSPVVLDSVVCAAAEAMGVAPQAARPAVLAAFARAKEAGMTMEEVIAGLAPPAAASKAKR